MCAGCLIGCSFPTEPKCVVAKTTRTPFAVSGQDTIWQTVTIQTKGSCRRGP